MKYICLGYVEEKKWDALSESERNTFVEDCMAYSEMLRNRGHVIAEETLQSVRTATTLRLQNGRVSIADGPYAETEEQLGEILVLEATDLNHAIQLMSRHPGFRLGGCFEVRPAEK
jgi:hypothetical protein